MKYRWSTVLVCILLLGAALGACAPGSGPAVGPGSPADDPPPPSANLKIVIIGKSVHSYWSNVEKGVEAAGRDLGVETIFFVPPQEDVAAQIQIVEAYIAQGVTGIAIAPADPAALEPVMSKAAAAGILVTTLDTPPVENSVSIVYIGTDNLVAGRLAGLWLSRLLPSGGLVGVTRGSDTALNALQRTEGFMAGVANSHIQILGPVNDKEDAATALQLANSLIAAHPDMVGAFGVYANNGPAWATAIKEADAVGRIKLVCFDATVDIINGIKEGVIDATIAQREYDMGYKSVQFIKIMAEQGEDAALKEMRARRGFIDTGVDIITASTLQDYEAELDRRGIPHDWTTEGWEPPDS